MLSSTFCFVLHLAVSHETMIVKYSGLHEASQDWGWDSVWNISSCSG